MKKLAALLSLSMLSACIYAGEMDIFHGRNKFFQIWQTEEIFYYDTKAGDEYLTESKTITEDSIERNQVLITKVGGIMAFSRTHRTDFYGSETLTVNKDAVMSSSYSPLYIKKNNKFEPFGETTFNGEKYMLVKQGKSGDVLMINGNGELFDRIGRVVDGRLAVLDITFFVEPEDVLFTPVVNTRSENTEVMDGWELRYDGIVNNYMRFTYSTLGENGQAEEFIFPTGQQTIIINDLRINVIEAGYNKIEYVIL